MSADNKPRLVCVHTEFGSAVMIVEDGDTLPQMTPEDSLAVWDIIKRLYRTLVRAEADKAAAIQILREELNESLPHVLSRLEDFRAEEFYQRAIHDCEKTLLSVEASIHASKDHRLLEALRALPTTKSVN